MRRRALFVLVAVAVLCSIQGGRTPTALACSCAKSPPQEVFQRSDAVFSGKVVSVKEQKRPGKNGGSYVEHAYTFQVDTNWKGVSGSRIVTYFYSDFITPSGSSLTGCTAEGFEVGKTYLVYAWRGTGVADYFEAPHKLSASLHYCSRTNLLVDAGEDLQVLGPGVAPSQPVGSGPFSMIGAFGWIGGLLAWFLGLLH